MAGRFIVFEGPDGCGKTTMVEAARRHLEVREIACTFVQDPGGTRIGGQLRKVLLDPANDEMAAMTELLLYVASRAQLVDEIIRPALLRGEVVVADRFFLSTLVYQGVAGAVSEEELHSIIRLGVARTEPDHVLLLDVPADVGLERVGTSRDRMEQKGLFFHQQVRQRYLGYADCLPPETVTVIDASQPLLEVKRQVIVALDAVLDS